MRHSFCRGTQPIEGTCGGAEGFVALMTDEPLLLANGYHVPLASGSGRAVLMGQM